MVLAGPMVLRRTAAVLLALSVAGGCSSIPVWRAPAEVRAPDHEVAEALGDTDRSRIADFDPDAIPVPPEPTNLRPCCAFGANLRVALGKLPLPGVMIGNIRAPRDLGPHKYNIGLLEVGASNDSGRFESENNGLVYTCRGGFLDTAHVRDWADTTVFLIAEILRGMDAGATIDLSDQGGLRRVVLRPVDKNLIANPGRQATAVAIAQWAAFQLAVWHEIATWYGYASVAGWPEKISTFSPEDLYSDMLGIKIAGGVTFQHDTYDEHEYNKAMDAWIAMTMKRLQAVSRHDAREAMRSVAGIWWDPGRRIPDWQLTMRRNMDVGPLIKPWLVSMAFAPEHGPFNGCKDARPPLALSNPDRFEGVPFTHMARVEVDVSNELARHDFPFPRKDGHTVTEADFPLLIQDIRRQNALVFGERGDRPER